MSIRIAVITLPSNSTAVSRVDLIIGHSAACYALASLVTFLQHVDGYVYVCPGTGPEPPQ